MMNSFVVIATLCFFLRVRAAMTLAHSASVILVPGVRCLEKSRLVLALALPLWSPNRLCIVRGQFCCDFW